MTAEQIERSLHDSIFATAYGSDWARAKHVDLWQSGKGGYAPLANSSVPNWDWSVDFGRWGASVQLADGWAGFTYPATYKDNARNQGQLPQGEAHE